MEQICGTISFGGGGNKLLYAILFRENSRKYVSSIF